MKFTAVCAAVALLASSTYAHTWLECVDVDVKNEAEARDPNVRAMPDYHCKGYPRNKIYDGDWIKESTFYSYTLNSQAYDTTHACRQDIQSKLGQEAPGKPMLTAKPGQELRMRFWGNGHSDYHVGSPRNADPGVVRVYWAGEPEKQIELVEDLTEKYWVPGAQSNFSENSITWRDVTPMKEPGNFMKWKLPQKIQNGVHAFVFTWANRRGTGEFQPLEKDVYNKYWENTFTTCFDIKIEGSDYTEAHSDAIRKYQAGYDERKAEQEDLAATCAGTCYHFGNEGMPCTENCPPCRINDPKTNKVACYQMDPATGSCPFKANDCGGLYNKKRNVLARSHARKHRRARRV